MYSVHRGRCETEAESVAQAVTKALGLDSAPYTDAYVRTWADGDLDMVKDCAETVLRVAKGHPDRPRPIPRRGTRQMGPYLGAENPRLSGWREHSSAWATPSPKVPERPATRTAQRAASDFNGTRFSQLRDQPSSGFISSCGRSSRRLP